MKTIVLKGSSVGGRRRRKSTGRRKKKSSSSRRKSTGRARRVSLKRRRRRSSGALKKKDKAKSKSAGRRVRRRRKGAAARRGNSKRRASSKGRKGRKKGSVGRRRRRRSTGAMQQYRQQGRGLGAFWDGTNMLIGAGLGNWGLGNALQVGVAQFTDLGDHSRKLLASGLQLGLVHWLRSFGAVKRMPIVSAMLLGAEYISVFGLLSNGVKLLGSPEQTLVDIGALNRKRISDFAGGGLVSGGRVGVSILTKGDLLAKIEEQKAERDELEGALGAVAGDLSPEQDAVYVSAAEHIASVEGPLRAAEKLLENGRLYEGGEAIKDAMSLAIVGRALLSGLTAGAVAQVPGQQQQLVQQQLQLQQQLPAQLPAEAQAVAQQQITAQQQQLAQILQQGGQGLGDQLQIQDAESGQVQQVGAPSFEQVGVVTTGGMVLALDSLALWAQWVAQQYPGWSPSEVATAFILKYLNNQGHFYGFGINPVKAHDNWAAVYGSGAVSGPGTTMGYSNVMSSQAGEGIALTTGGHVYTCGGSDDEVLATVSGIFENQLGLL